jgi:hypothetical protein
MAAAATHVAADAPGTIPRIDGDEEMTRMVHSISSVVDERVPTPPRFYWYADGVEA